MSWAKDNCKIRKQATRAKEDRFLIADVQDPKHPSLRRGSREGPIWERFLRLRIGTGESQRKTVRVVAKIVFQSLYILIMASFPIQEKFESDN